MKPTKTLIKTFTNLLTSLNQSDKIQNFIYHRLHWYLDIMKRNETNRHFIKYLMYDYFDIGPDARDVSLNPIDILNSTIWNEIKKLILM